MSCVTILGAGPLGDACAAVLALTDVARRIVLVDESAPEVAVGRALDIHQSLPFHGIDVGVSGCGQFEVVRDADVILVADRGVDRREWEGEGGLAMLARALEGTSAPVVFVGNHQRWLLEKAVRELGVDWRRAIGSAAIALEGGVRAVTALEADCPASDVHLVVVGRPPDQAQVVWEWACIEGQAAAERLDASTLRRIDARVPALWPPGVQAAASAASNLARPMLADRASMRTCVCLAPGLPSAAALPARLARAGILDVTLPSTGRARAVLGL